MANKEDKKDVDRILGSDSTSAGAKEPKATGLEASAGTIDVI